MEVFASPVFFFFFFFMVAIFYLFAVVLLVFFLIAGAMLYFNWQKPLFLASNTDNQGDIVRSCFETFVLEQATDAHECVNAFNAVIKISNCIGSLNILSKVTGGDENLSNLTQENITQVRCVLSSQYKSYIQDCCKESTMKGSLTV